MEIKMHLIKANTLNTETSALPFYDALQFTVFIHIFSHLHVPAICGDT